MYKQYQFGIPIILRISFSTTASNLKKYAKDNVLKKYNKENKQLFGALLETQAQRKKRLKLDGLLNDSDTNQTAKNKGYKVGTIKLKYKIPAQQDVSKSDEGKLTTLPMKIHASCDYSSLSLTEILKKEFPLENPSKAFISSTSSQNKQLVPNFVKHQDKTQTYYPSVTSILSATMSPLARKALERWRKNKIAALGMDGFLAMNKATLQKGKDFHSAIQKMLTDNRQAQDLDVAEDIRNCIKSAENVLKQISKVQMLEGEVVHEILQYRGYVDCICDMGNISNVAIEWKKSDSKKSTIDQTYDAPLQLAAYMGAINYDNKFSYQVTSGVVVVVYEDGSPASVFPVLADYWTHWYRRYQAFHVQEMEGSS